MINKIINTNTLQDFLKTLIVTEKVIVKEDGGVVQLTPLKDDGFLELRGILADFPKITVDKFLERKRADKELEI